MLKSRKVQEEELRRSKAGSSQEVQQQAGELCSTIVHQRWSRFECHLLECYLYIEVLRGGPDKQRYSALDPIQAATLEGAILSVMA